MGSRSMFLKKVKRRLKTLVCKFVTPTEIPASNGLPRPTIDIVCVTFRQDGPLRVLIQSFINQTQGNWRLFVIHDGPDDDFTSLSKEYKDYDNIEFHATDIRHNDYGSSLRDEGLKKVSSDYVLLTNGDNYYVPRFIEIVSNAAASTKADAIMYDMIHSHDRPGARCLPPYSFFRTKYSRYNIDMGAAIVRSSLAKAAGFHDKSSEGDATYFEDVARLAGNDFKVHKVKQVLFVHN